MPRHFVIKKILEVESMKEVFAMWKNTKMIVLVALTAAIYAAILIPFKAIPIIPGFKVRSRKSMHR